MKALKFYLNDVELVYSPQGWPDINLKWERPLTYWGMIRSYSFPMKFVKDGAKMLRSAYYQNGVHAEMTFKIERLDPIALTYYAEKEGSIDFNTFDDKDNAVTVNIIDGGLGQLIKANEKTIYEIDVPLTNKIIHQGVVVGYDYAGYASDLAGGGAAGITGGVTVARKFTISNYSASNNNNSAYSASSQVDVNGYLIKANRECWLKIDLTGNFTLNAFTYDGDYHDGSFHFLPINYKLQLRTTTGLIIPLFDKNLTVLNENLPTTTLNVDIAGTYNVSLNANEELSMWIVMTTPNQWYEASMLSHNVDIVASIASSLGSYEYYAMQPAELFNELIKKITNNQFEGHSTFLEETLRPDNFTHKERLVVSGSCVRGITNVIKTCLSDFFKSFDAIEDLAFGFETVDGVDRCVIEPKSYFFSNETAINLGKVSDLSISGFSDIQFNRITAGYPSNEYNTEFGNDEFNSEQIWNFPESKNLNKPLDTKSAYRADMFGIDTYYQNLINNPTVDSEEDNQIFIVDCLLSETVGGVKKYILDRYSGKRANYGMDFLGLVYNVDLSPRKCLIRKASFLKSLFINESTILKMASADKNANVLLQYYFDDGNQSFILYHQESEDIDLSEEVGDPLFYPILFKFKCNSKRRYIDNLNSSASGKLTFEWKGSTYSGYVLNASVNLTRNAEIEYTLIASRDNDLTKLIQ